MERWERRDEGEKEEGTWLVDGSNGSGRPREEVKREGKKGRRSYKR